MSSFALPNTTSDAGEEPCGLAITDSGSVFYASFSPSFTGTWAIHKLDTSKGTVTDYQTLQDGAFTEDAFTRMLLTTDNARVFGNMHGLTFSIDTSTDAFFFNPTLQFASDYELTLSSNQTWMSAGEFLMDTNLNLESYVVYVDRDVWNQSTVYGEKVSPDGSLLFSPLFNAIDVIDGRLGTLRARIALPFTLSANYDALVDDGRDNVLIAITGQTGDGIAVIDLSSLPEGVASLAATTQRPDLLRMAQWTANSSVGKPKSTNLIKRTTPPTLIRPKHNSVSPVLRLTPGRGTARTEFAKPL